MEKTDWLLVKIKESEVSMNDALRSTQNIFIVEFAQPNPARTVAANNSSVRTG